MLRKEKILTIDDDPDILDVLLITLSDQYEITQAANGQEGLQMVQQKNPDLIICDYMMPLMTGPEFCKALKKDILLRHIPIIMLTGKGDTQDIVKGIDAGADDYIVKPFEPDSLLARIKMILRRTVRSLDANPLTHLPGNSSIMEEIQDRINSGQAFAVGYTDLDKFKNYNDKYGFEKGDEIIKSTARILVETVRDKGGTNGFVGHIGGDDFVFVVEDAHADDTSKAIIEKFDRIAPQFYSEEDRKQGFILGKDRQGNEMRVGLLSISIGIVSNANFKITHVGQIAEIGAELKKFAKSLNKSNFVRNQRRE